MRSVKPEYFADQDLAEDLPGPEGRDARLLYVGLWGQADEHARLRGDARWIKGQIYPFDDDITPAVVDRLIDMIAASGRAIRYRVGKSTYLFLPKLAEHQRLEPDKTPSRLPDMRDEQAEVIKVVQSENFPDKSEPSAEELALAHARSFKHVAGGREQVAGAAAQLPLGEFPAVPQNEEPPPAGAAGAAIEATAEPRTARDLVAWWIEQCTTRPPGKVIGHMSKEIKNLVDEGIDPGIIRTAIGEWITKDLSPSLLPNLVNSVMNRQPRASPGTALALPGAVGAPRQATNDRKYAEHMALAEQLRALEGAPHDPR